jgi:hypothetical protein
MTTPTNLMQCYLEALSSQNIDAIRQLSGPRSLIEIPFLKPNRLIGDREIVKAHEQIFANLESVRFVIEHSADDGAQAIAEGRLELRRDGREQSHAAGLVAESDAEGIGRVSLYCNARNVRLWSDKTIL